MFVLSKSILQKVYFFKILQILLKNSSELPECEHLAMLWMLNKLLTYTVNFNECEGALCQNGGSCNDHINSYNCSVDMPQTMYYCFIMYFTGQ